MLQLFSHRSISLFVSFLLLLLSSCMHNDEKDEALQVAHDFAELYFNWRYTEAMTLADSTCQKELRFLASQVNENDVRALNQREVPASVEITSIETKDGNNYTIEIHAENFLEMDAIGQDAKLVKEAFFNLKVKQVDGKKKWKVFQIPLKNIY